jgi:nucleotide-binding universal stress UspA family protein
MITRILAATDGSEVALRGVQYAAYLATELKARVVLIHIVELEASPLNLAADSEEERIKFREDLMEAGRSIIRLSQKPLADAGIAADYEVMEGRPAESICRYAADGQFDLIIVGNRGRSKLSRTILGSVSDEVVRVAHCPVLVVR